MAEQSTVEGANARKEMILAAAAELVAERGFARTTVRDIGKRIGMLSGSLYHYFESKEAIADELLNRFWVKILRDYDEIVSAEASPRETLRQMIRAAHKAMTDFPAEIQLLNSDWRQLAEFQNFREIRNSSTKVSDVWVKVMQAGVDAGEFRDDVDLRVAYRTMMGSIQTLYNWYDPQGPLSREAIADEQASLFLDGLAKPGKNAG
jgi:AcrR family transcriptional regulator